MVDYNYIENCNQSMDATVSKAIRENAGGRENRVIEIFNTSNVQQKGDIGNHSQPWTSKKLNGNAT